MRIVTKINRRLLELGWTESRLALEAGMQPSVVNRIKNGHREPRVRTALTLAKVMGTSVEALFAEA